MHVLDKYYTIIVLTMELPIALVSYCLKRVALLHQRVLRIISDTIINMIIVMKDTEANLL